MAEIVTRIELTTPKKLGVIWWLCLVVFIFLVAIFVVTMYLENVSPKYRPEHENLLTLFPNRSPHEFNSKRMKILTDDYFFVASHGVGNATDGIELVTDERDGVRRSLTVNELAEVINHERRVRGISDKLPIYLMACNASAGLKPFSKQLSEILGVKVIGPNEWLIIDHIGKIRTGPHKWTAYFYFGRLSFKVFYPTIANTERSR